MSYLESPRIVFSGRYQADVSTVNNDVRHYDNVEFESRFQDPQAANGDLNGWWNPDGTGAFRIIDAKVTGVAPGGASTIAEPVVGLTIASNIDGPPPKLVDLDPQFQFGSMIWGLSIVLTDGDVEYLRADYAPTPFRDLVFGRIGQRMGSSFASAKFTSVLQNIVWDPAADRSPALRALKEAADAVGGRLSISLTTIGYDTNSKSDNFTFGLLVGAIGPWRDGEPLFFPAARRLAPTDANNPPLASLSTGFNFCDAWTDGRRVTLDLSNAIPLQDRTGTVTDLGPLALAMLRTPDQEVVSGDTVSLTPGIPQGASVAAADYAVIGEIPYGDPDWLRTSAGIVSFETDLGDALNDHPLALIGSGSGGGQVVLLRETTGGYFIRADAFEQRVDSVADEPRLLEVDIYARRFGQPLGGAPLSLQLEPRQSGGGDGGFEPDPPKSPLPDVNFPAAAIGLAQGGAYATDKQGVAAVSIAVSDPGSPRDYLEGQIYSLDYAFGDAIQGASPMHFLDLIVLHVRQAFSGPSSPQWSDVAPILTQFANLYPVMSRRMFDFSDSATAGNRAKILRFALTRPIGDPNHMPVTRDLSEGKRAMLVAWLDKFAPELPPSEATPVAADTLELRSTAAGGSFDTAPVAKATRHPRLAQAQRLKGMSTERVEEEEARAEAARPATPPTEER
jgi:hypothetical protein